MKHLLLTIILSTLGLAAVAVPPASSSRQTERLAYDVYYHWGFIWKKAGYGELTVHDETLSDGTHRNTGKLAARSLSIVESIMRVRDTLQCWYTPDMVPIEYCKKTHEGSYQAEERNYYTTRYKDGATTARPADVSHTTVDVRRWRSKKGNDQRQHHIDEAAYDMLSVFYAIRALDFKTMHKGQCVRFPIFSGIKKADYMTVEFCGAEKCQLRSGKTYDAYRLELTFRSKDSDQTPLHVYLAQTPDHRPLKVTIQLQRVGEIQGQIVE